MGANQKEYSFKDDFEDERRREQEQASRILKAIKDSELPSKSSLFKYASRSSDIKSLVHPPRTFKKISPPNLEADKKRLKDFIRIPHIKSFNESINLSEEKFKSYFYQLYDKSHDYKQYMNKNKIEESMNDLKEIASQDNIKDALNLLDTKELSNMKPQNSKDLLKDLLNPEWDIDEDKIDIYLNRLNERDEKEISDASYVYPYHDEPFLQQNAQDTINNWADTIIKHEGLNTIEKQIMIMKITCMIIKSKWNLNRPHLRVLYGYYMARDIYMILSNPRFSINQYPLIENLVDYQFDYESIREEWSNLDKDISYLPIFKDVVEYFDKTGKIDGNYITTRSETIEGKINIWVDSWKL